MLDVHREILTNGFMLIVSPDGTSTDEIKLTRALHRASRSDKAAVLIDLSLIDELSAEAIDLLLAYAFLLHNQGRRLILCHVPQPAQHHFLFLDVASQPLLVPSLLDAMQEIDFMVGQNQVRS